VPDATGLELIAAGVRERLGGEAVVGTVYHRGQATLDVAPEAVRDAIIDIISIAQHARPKLIGQIAFLRPQLINLSNEVVSTD